jgi:pSer/pThr/pTyr-binding forkhead associated (FHA) protein
VFCTRCGQQNPQDAAFCAKCGAPLAHPATLSGAGPERPAEQTSVISAVGVEDAAVAAADGDTGAEHVAAAADPATLASLPAGSALLVVKRGPNAGSRFLLDEPVTTAGRHPDSDIFLDDVTVSRRHAEFRRETSGGLPVFLVRDVGSLNGTYVNRERIDAAELSGGDEVQIGKFRLVFLTAATGTALG